MSLPDTIARLRAAFPGDDELHRSVRVAFLGILFAGQNAEDALGRVAERVAIALEDPPFSVAWGMDEAKRLAAKLRALASELEKQSSVIDRASAHWQSFDDSNGAPPVYWKRKLPEVAEESAVVDLRRPDTEEPVPF